MLDERQETQSKKQGKQWLPQGEGTMTKPHWRRPGEQDLQKIEAAAELLPPQQS